ncbi:gamma-glutamylputrescine oxidase [Pseudorhodobacter antarcticus]|uniref:Gamma-glutamylputrescine oxidase n=1 Tax=Pseudorhodobacter antarcticus TaxID=1077947 RepID=A0A1H8I9C4_9RHOB|nr:FAD-binding oxidoreductase [Pseudorhodobacter antarcticus]SEN64911.1 gamma-glutamylputrescine oxidase [Pseudorhodobacter antarcticus]
MNLLYANDKPGEFPPSYYAATATPLDRFAPLKGQTVADVCIVGGGYTGLSAALHCVQAGLSVVLLEAHRVGFGASGRNGGQVGSGQRLEQDALEKLAGIGPARALWDMGEEAKTLVRELAASMGVPFHAGVAHACYTQAEVDHGRGMAEKLARDYGYLQVEPLPEGLIGSRAFKGGDVDRGAGHLHPLNFALGLARMAVAAGARIFERSEVHQIVHGLHTVVQTATGRVSCKHVILAGNGYLAGLDQKVAARVMPINNFIVATEPLGDYAAVLAENIAVADSKFVVSYWRLSDDKRLLFGGGESYGYRFPDIVKTVRKPMLAIYPQLRDARIDYAWGGTLAITMNRMPCFIRSRDNVVSASGYSGHGVAMATLAGKLLAQTVRGQAGGFDVMAALPQPRFPGGAALRWPLLAAAMTWYGLRDRFG